MTKIDRILWNRRPEHDLPGGGGDIDEVVLHDVKLVHIEQMDDRAWWIGIHVEGDDDPYWMGNFICGRGGQMRFVEQENHGIVWHAERSHEDDRPKAVDER